MTFPSFRKSLVVAALAGTLALTASIAHAHRGDGTIREMLRQLDLDLVQRQDVRQMFKQGKSDSKLLRADMRDMQQQIHALLHQESLDSEQLLELLKERQTLGSTQAFKRAQYHHQLWTILDQQQRDKFASLTEARMQQQALPQLLRRLEKLNLSDNQRDIISDLEAGLAAQREVLTTRIKEAKAKEHALIRSEQFSEAQWQALYQTYQQDFLNLALLSAQTRHQIWQILDDDQQQRVREHRQHRGNKRDMRGAPDFMI